MTRDQIPQTVDWELEERDQILEVKNDVSMTRDQIPEIKGNRRSKMRDHMPEL